MGFGWVDSFLLQVFDAVYGGTFLDYVGGCGCDGVGLLFSEGVC